jgi:hypothetical protein
MRQWLARALVGLVFFTNLECAVLFLWKPEAYAPSFDLAGPAGIAWIRGLGLLFLISNRTSGSGDQSIFTGKPLRNDSSAAKQARVTPNT